MVQNKPDPEAEVAKRRRGRPRAFQPSETLQHVLQTFWSKGYSATSMDDLAQATGLNRPSLYAAFGNKRALYETVLQNYWELSFQALKDALSGNDTLEAALNRVYERALVFYIPKDGPSLGCFAIGTAVTEAADDPGIRATLAAGLRKFDDDLEKRIRTAQGAGELSPTVDCRALAMLASATMHSIAIRARAGESREALAEFGRNAARMIGRS